MARKLTDEQLKSVTGGVETDGISAKNYNEVNDVALQIGGNGNQPMNTQSNDLKSQALGLQGKGQTVTVAD